MRPKKHLSQFFLINKKVLSKIADSVASLEGGVIVEIGSGSGELTGYLLGKSERLICVEVDPELSAVLKKKYKENQSIEVYNQSIESFKIDHDEVIIVGNSPYHLSFKILEFIIKNREKVRKAYLTLQKEFAQKLLPVVNTKKYGFLSCFVNLYAEASVKFSISKSCFYPRPKVDSIFIELTIHAQPRYAVRNEDFFIAFTRSIFNQRRKKISNILKSLNYSVNTQDVLSQCKISGDLRPENIPLSQLVSLANSLHAAMCPGSSSL